VISTIAWGALGALWALDAVRLRGRARALRTLEPSDEPVSPEHGFIVRDGVVLEESVRRAASAHARANGLDVLDLIPRDLPAPDAFFLLQTLDAAKFRDDRLAKAYSAGEAILVTTEVARRMNLSDERPRDTLAFSKLAHRLKQYAPVTMDYAVAPGLRASRRALRARGLIRMAFGDLAFPVIYTQLALAVAGPLVAPIAGSVALAAIHLQSAIALVGTALHPRRLLAHGVLRTPWELFRTFGGGDTVRRDAREESAKLRDRYADLLSGGVERFFEPRRDDCPLCGGRSLKERLSIRDQLQFKPGRFRLDECRGCGHIFQNPRLSIDGLDFYYSDFYDGLGEEGLESIFASSAQQYVERARFVEVAVNAPPARWLDVGAGHGHFANVVHDILTTTRVEGVDLSSSIEEAERRGWIAKGYRALFPEAAAGLARDPYDVVSMSHYLEHTRDPAGEIAAAAQVLRQGGHLFIEVPDPESRLGMVLGRWWLPWFQPQHQHFLSVARLDGLLRKHGFEPVAWHRGEAHQRVDFSFAVGLLARRIAPPLDMPWREPDGVAARAWHRLVWTLAVPLLVAGKAADLTLAPLLRREGWSNTFRVVAKRL
jgi:SAM-dependent methyltransferase